MPHAKMRALGKRFRPDRCDAEAPCDLAVAGSMRSVTFVMIHCNGVHPAPMLKLAALEGHEFSPIPFNR